MEKEYKISEKEKRQRERIINICSELRDESTFDREKVFLRFSAEIFRLCSEYWFTGNDQLNVRANFPDKEAEMMGLEIHEFVLRLVDKDKRIKKNVPEKEEEFFKYLRTSLDHERDRYYGNNTQDAMRIPKWKKNELREDRQYLEIVEQNMRRPLSEEEKIHHLRIGRDKTEKQARKNLELLNSRATISLDTDNGGKIADISIDNPEDDFLTNMDMELLRYNAEKFLNKKQNRTREVHRELFTLASIKKIKNYEKLLPVLSERIIEGYKKGETFTQPKIYLYHHSQPKKVKPKSAEARASTMWGEMRTYLKEKKS